MWNDVPRSGIHRGFEIVTRGGERGSKIADFLVTSFLNGPLELFCRLCNFKNPWLLCQMADGNTKLLNIFSK